MPFTSTGLELVEDGNAFVLRVKDARGAITETRMTEAQLITLIQSTPKFQEIILARHAPKGEGISPVVVTPVVQIELNENSLGEGLLLTPIASNGSRMTFELPPEIVRHLIARLPVRLAALEAKKLTKQ
jgi:hypothetical protein